MAEILINGERVVLGKMTVSRTLVYEGEKPIIVIEGTLVTHRYFEEITKIETERLTLGGIEVVQESFGSNHNEISYVFRARGLEIAGGESHLTDEEVERLEQDLYGGDVDDNAK